MKTSAKNLQETIDESRQQVAARLVALREQAGVSVQHIVDETGLSRSGIDKMESGRSNPTVHSVGVYARACGRTLAEFFEPWTDVTNGNGAKRKNGANNGNGGGRKSKKSGRAA